MPKTDNKSEAIRVNVTPQLRRALEDLANRHEVPVAHIIRRAIRFYLAENNEGYA